MIIVNNCDLLTNKFGGFLSKTIHSTGMPVDIIIEKRKRWRDRGRAIERERYRGRDIERER